VTDPYHSNIQKTWLRIPKDPPDTVPYKSICDSLQLTKLLSRAEESTKQVLHYDISDSSEKDTVEAFTGRIPKAKPPPKWFLNYYPKLLAIYERSISKNICFICHKKVNSRTKRNGSRELARHIAAKHAKHAKLPCSVPGCLRKYRNDNTLSELIRNAHSREVTKTDTSDTTTSSSLG
jgi:hypothetical protein